MSHWLTSGASRLKARQTKNRSFSARAQQRSTAVSICSAMNTQIPGVGGSKKEKAAARRRRIAVGETVSLNTSRGSDDQQQDVVNDDGQRYFGQAGRDRGILGRHVHETGLRPMQQLLPQLQSLPTRQDSSAVGIRELSSLATRQDTSLQHVSLQSRTSVVNNPVAAMQRLAQQQQLHGGYNPFRHPAGISAMDLASSENSVLSNHGLLHTRSPHGMNALAAHLLQQKQRQRIGAFSDLSRILPSPSVQQDDEILEFLARDDRSQRGTLCANSSLGYSRLGIPFAAFRTDAFHLPSTTRLQMPIHQDEFCLTHSDMARPLTGSAAGTTYAPNQTDDQKTVSRGLKRLESASSEESSFSDSAKRRKPSDASLSLSQNKDHSHRTPAGGIAKFKERPKSSTPKKRKQAVDLLHNAHDLEKSSSNLGQASPIISELASAGVRFFNNGAEVDLQGRARNIVNDEVVVDSKPTPSSKNSSDKSNEIVDLYAYQKSIWDAFTSVEGGDGAKSLKGPKKKKRRKKSIGKPNPAPTAGVSSHKDHSFASELDTSPRNLSGDPDKIAHAAVEDLVRDSMRERENTLSAASVLMEFLSGGATQDTKIAKQA